MAGQPTFREREPVGAAAVSATPAVSPTRQPPPSATAEQENLFWQSITNSTNPAEFEAYLTQFPNGVFRALAEVRLAATAVVGEPICLRRPGVLPAVRPHRLPAPGCQALVARRSVARPAPMRRAGPATCSGTARPSARVGYAAAGPGLSPGFSRFEDAAFKSLFFISLHLVGGPGGGVAPQRPADGGLIMASTSFRERLSALTAVAFWAVFAADAVAQGSVAPALDRPRGSIHNAGNWGHNWLVVEQWEQDPSKPLLPPSYVEYLKSMHVNWVGLSVSLHVDDSMDSIVKRKYSPDIATPTFTDEVIRQIVREYRQHEIDVYLTLAFELNEASEAERPVERYLFGEPGDPETGKLEPGGLSDRIDPEFWPWWPSHPDHERFVAEFWRTYTEQAVHFARIAQEEGVRMFSLGTETDSLFRTRHGGYWPNDFLRELRTMVASVRAVYDGLVTYDMHWRAYVHDRNVPGSRYLWEDLDLDVMGVSAWFPLVEEPPTMVLSVEHFRREYERIFRDYLIPVAAMNERPMAFLEYGLVDTVEAPAHPSGSYDEPAPFSDMNGNGLDDGREQQANVIEAMLRTVNAYPGVVYGAFFWDDWIWDSEGYARFLEERPSGTFSFRGKLGEHVVRARHDDFRSLLWLPVKTLYLGEDAYVVPVELPNASSYTASSAAPDVATVTVSGSMLTVSPVAEGVASVTVTGEGAADTLQFTVVVRDLETERGALEALYRATDGDDWTNDANWLTETPLGEWYGVEAYGQGHVTRLQLGTWDPGVGDALGNGLVGTLPPELGDLAHLRRLAIEGNELTGGLPAELGQLTELRELRLGSNGLTGPLPAELGQLTELRRLRLSSNGLTGPLPPELGNLTNLHTLNLTDNAFTGTIPATLANLTDLEWLSLGEGLWTSEPAPEWLGALTSLRALVLGGHRLTGPIPATWQNLGNLEVLVLWGNALTGSIPAWFGSLTRLRTLRLDGNALTGPIPTSLTRLSDLSRFDIRRTGVCVPDDPAIQAWLATIADFRSSGLACEGSPPVVTATLPNRTLAQGSTLDVDLSRAFVDPDGDTLTYTVSSSAPHVATALTTGSMMRLTAVRAGTATIWVTATDPGGLSAAQSFTVTVTPPENRAPEPVGRLVPLTIGVDESPVTVEVSGAFRDPDGDRLTYGARSATPSVASVLVSGSRVTVTPVSEGSALVTVTATDTSGSNTTAVQSFTVTVGTGAPFTDHPLVAGVTPLRAVHFTELRSRIDGVRAAVGLARFAWTDPVLRPGVTPVKLVHLLELRSALAAAYTESGRSSPSWTDASPTAGSTPIRALHLTELRAAVLALE